VTLDRTSLLERFEGDEELFREVAQLFLEDAPQQLLQLRRALSAGAARDAMRAAHTLKGAVGNFAPMGQTTGGSATRAMAAALALEQRAGGGDLTGLEPLVAELETALAKLRNELSEVAGVA
jgi:HPt (histidine-containing phosphotransfer) domain-containing protein